MESTLQGYNFYLHTSEIVDNLRLIQSNTKASVSILFEGIHNDRQVLHLPAYHSDEQPTRQESIIHEQNTLLIDLRASDTDDNKRAAAKIHAFGSYTKNTIAYAFFKLAERRSDPEMLNIHAEDFVNRLSRKRDPQAAHIKLPLNPKLRELMLHRGCFPHMNGLLFAPDGTFVFSREDFLNIKPSFITSRFEGRKGSYQYSNGNYILLGIILELALGMTLDEALYDLVFKELNMDCSTVDHQRVETNGSRVVQGFQLSADLSPMAVNSTNLLRDSTESSAMGLRSSLDDIAKFNLELLRRLDAESSADTKRAEAFDFFVGEESTFGGLVSRPAEGVFQSETPTFYLRADYKATPLGKLSTKSKIFEYTRAAARRTFGSSKRDLTKLINHKAGYIDGHSSNVIVFENQGDVLIIVSNSTGACDVVHHMSRYLLQEILGLSPQITAADARRETKACTETLKSLEQSILLGEHDVSNPEDRLIGIYRHEDCAQMIDIKADGKVFFRGSDPDKVSSPMLMTYEAGNHNAIRLFIDATHLPLEAWSVWANLSFQVLDVDNVVGLSHEGGNGVYWKV